LHIHILYKNYLNSSLGAIIAVNLCVSSLSFNCLGCNQCLFPWDIYLIPPKAMDSHVEVCQSHWCEIKLLIPT
jgi:hypothetical protein